MVNRIKKLYSTIYINDENYSLEQRLLLSALVIGLFICLLGIICNSILTTSYIAIIIPAILLLIFLFLYWLVRVKKLYRSVAFPATVIGIIGAAFIWVFNGGINGSNIMPAFVVLVLGLVVVNNKTKKYVILLFISINIIILLIQLYYPQLIVKFPSELDRWIDNIINLISSSILLFFIIHFVHKNYTIERNRAEESEMKFRSITENSQDFISRYDREHRRIYINSAGLIKFNFKLDEIIGKTNSEINLFGSQINKLIETHIEDTFITKLAQSNLITWIRKDEVCYLDWRAFPELNDQDEVQTVLVVARDVSEMKINELKLAKLNSDKDRFMSILGHDLKSPFNAILGYSELLINDYDRFTPESVLEKIKIVNAMSQNTFNLLEDLLLWTKTQTGSLNYQPKNLDFLILCSETIEEVKANALVKNIKINYFSTLTAPLWADQNMLRTILRNLVSNAIKFTNANGKINIYAENKNEYNCITVSDNGIGIDNKTLENIWNLGSTHSRYGTANEKGTGLGLLLCKEFINIHKGEIEVNSEIGVGSDFIISLPCKKEK